MVNKEIRHRVFDTGVRYKEIAGKMGIRADYLCRIMRFPLSDRNRKRIEKAIKELTTERGNTNNG